MNDIIKKYFDYAIMQKIGFIKNVVFDVISIVVSSIFIYIIILISSKFVSLLIPDALIYPPLKNKYLMSVFIFWISVSLIYIFVRYMLIIFRINKAIEEKIDEQQ